MEHCDKDSGGIIAGLFGEDNAPARLPGSLSHGGVFGDCFAAGKKELGELPVPAFLGIKKKNIWF